MAVKAIQPLVGFPIKACTQVPVSGSRDIRTVADAAEFFASAGLPVEIRDTGLMVGCDAADYAISPGLDAPQGSYSAGGLLGPSASPSRSAALQGVPMAPPEPPIYHTVSAKWVKRDLLGQIGAALGVKMVFDTVPEHPILLAGPADAVSQARAYISALNVCPVQLSFEASVIQRSDSDIKDRDIGLRLGGSSAGIGTAGTSSATGLNFSWLTGFLEATHEVARFRVNATHSAMLMAGETVQLRDGGQTPVRAATSVTDRETRVDVVYKNTGHNLDLQLLAMDGPDALLMIDQSYSSVGTSTDLGPSFANRSVKSTLRVPIGEPVVIAVAGADSVSTSKRRGILHRGDYTNTEKGGSFLVFQLARVGCREREPASADDKPTRVGKPKNMQEQ